MSMWKHFHSLPVLQRDEIIGAAAIMALAALAILVVGW